MLRDRPCDRAKLTVAVFHHDSPYDACSPHRNINQRAAPVRAFDARVDPATVQLLERHRAEQEVGGGEDAARSLRAPADARRHYADEEGEPDPQNTDYWGMPTEPWQEMQESRPAPVVHPGHSRQSSASSGVDMETILSGGRHKQGGTQSWLPEDAPAANTALGGARAGDSDSKVQRSTSFMGKLRRLRLDPDEVVGSGTSGAQRRRSMMVPGSVSETPEETGASNSRLRRNTTVFASSQPQEETAAPTSRRHRNNRTTVDSSTRQKRSEPPAVPPKQQQGSVVVQEPAIPAYLSTGASTPAAGTANTPTRTSGDLSSPTERSSSSERAGQERPRTLLGRLTSTRRK